MADSTLLKLLRLPPRAWLLMVEIAVTALWVEAGLRLLPFKRLARLSLRASPRRQPPPQVRLDELMRLADAAFRRAPGLFTCLKRALILSTLLARRGLQAELNIGVRKTDEALHAHAWLEQDGLVIADHPQVVEQFRPLEMEVR